MNWKFIKSNLFIKIIICAIAAISSLFICITPAWACTGVYVGSDVSEDGTTLIGRSNDWLPENNPLFVKVYGGSDGEKIKQIHGMHGFTWDLPDNINRTICFPTARDVDHYNFNATAINDKGLSITATVTGASNTKSLEFNPFVEDGIGEDMFPLTIAASCSTAREGIELTAKIIDEKGSCEDNIIMLGDKNEAWYMEIYGGHQYCAIKCPTDCVAVFGNEFNIETVDENSNDVICSKELFSLPKEKGFAVYKADGKMDIERTYADEVNDGSRMRTWIGHKILSPSTVGDYSATTKYPLFYKPDTNVSIEDVMNIYRDRYNDTKYDLDINGKGTYRSISVDKSQSTHIIQIFKNLPEDINLVDWVAFSNAEFNMFIPFSNKESKFDEAYTYEPTNYWNNDYKNACYNFKTLNVTAAKDRLICEKGIQKYWAFLQHYYAAQISQLLENSSATSNIQNKINDMCTSFQNQSVYDAKRLLQDLHWYYNDTEDCFGLKTRDGNKYYQPPYNFSPYVDVALVSKMYGWNIEENKIQLHNDNIKDETIWGNAEEADNGGNEGYIKMTKDGNTIEVHTNNGHRFSTASIVTNGNSEEINAKMYDGKVYADISIVDKVEELAGKDSYSSITKDDLSINRSLENSFPIWLQVLAIIIVLSAICIAVLLIMKVIKSRKK